MNETRASTLIRKSRRELTTWIGRNPSYLLDYLDSKSVITRDTYKEANDLKIRTERAKFLIDEFLDRDECLVLVSALYGLQEDYPQLRKWFNEIGWAPGRDGVGSAGAGPTSSPAAATSTSVSLPSTAPPARSGAEKIAAYGDAVLAKRTRELSDQIIDALRGNLFPILNKLYARDVITAAEKDTVHTKNSNMGGECGATELLTIIDNKGGSKAKPFWEALHSTRDTYTKLMDIFDVL